MSPEIKTLEERGIPKDSYFNATFHDGSIADERLHNWSSFSEKKVVNYLGNKKSVVVSKEKIKHIKICHGNQSTELDIPDGCEVYQAIRAQTFFISGGKSKNTVMGRVVGLIKNGEVIEERVLNGVEGIIQGWKK
jgi:hypothetical protein